MSDVLQSVFDRGAGTSGAPAPPGLVPFSTSDFEGDERGSSSFPLIEINQREARLRRMRSGLLTAGRLIVAELEQEHARYVPWMLTFTYRPGEIWQPFHLTQSIKSYRIWADKNGFKLHYVWVAEIQEGRWARGDSLLGECVHYHLLIWVPARLSPPMADKQGWWSHGMTQRIRVRRPLRYLMKYSSKGESVQFPKGLRIHGCGGLSKQARNERTWWLMPKWVRILFDAADMPRRAIGGGIVSKLSGEWLPSIWQVVLTRGAVFIHLRDNLSDFFSVDRLLLLLGAEPF